MQPLSKELPLNGGTTFTNNGNSSNSFSTTEILSQLQTSLDTLKAQVESAIGNVVIYQNKKNFGFEKPIPPYSDDPPLYDSKTRADKYKSLLKMGSTTVPQGFARLIDIFADYFNECFNRCSKEVTCNKTLSKKIISTHQANIKDLLKVSNVMFSFFFELIESEEGLFNHALIEISRKKFVEEFYTAFKSSAETLPSNIPSYNDLINAIHLLKDTVCHDFQALSHFETRDSLSDNFDRILKRIHRMKQIVNMPKEDLSDKYFDLWENDKVEIIQICSKIESLIKQFNQSHNPALLEDVLKEFTPIELPRSLLKALAYDDDKDLADLKMVISNINNSLLMINFQGRTAILHYLMENKFINLDQCNQFLRDYCKCYASLRMTLLKCDFEEWRKQLSVLETNSQLSADDYAVIAIINGYISQESINEAIKSTADLDEILQRNWYKYKSAKTNGEQAASLQNFIDYVRSSENAHKLNRDLTLLNFIICKENPISPELYQLLLKIENLVIYLQKATEIPEILIKSLFKKGFQKLTTNSKTLNLQNENLASKSSRKLIQEEKQTTKKKKKKKPKPSPETLKTGAAPILLAPQEKTQLAEPKATPQPEKICKEEKKAAKLQAQNKQEAEVSNQLTQIFELSNKLLGQDVHGMDAQFRQTWRNAALNNLNPLLKYFEESQDSKEFSRDKIFTETNIVRQILEATLEVALAQFAVLNDKDQSVLRQLKSHELHLLVKELLAHHIVPTNVRNILFSLRSTAFALSQANTCVNYPYTTVSKKQLPNQASHLVNYLIKVDELSADEKPNHDSQVNLFNTHKKLVNESLRLTLELLKALENPEYGLNNYPEAGELLEKILDIPNFDNSENHSHQASNSSASNSSMTINSSMPEIKNRKEALNAIQTAKNWVLLRKVSLVLGEIDGDYRVDQRNAALKNVYLYLELLQEKLSKIHFQPHSLSFGVLGLLRRIHKELCIALLYHGEYYEGEFHIVDKQELRHQNDPCYLHEFLGKYADWSGDLIKTDKIQWMKDAHQILSYPTPLAFYAIRDFGDLTEIVKEVKYISDARKQNAKNKELVDPGFTLVAHGGEKISPDKESDNLDDRMQKLEHKLENKIFPALVKINEILHYGFDKATSQPKD